MSDRKSGGEGGRLLPPDVQSVFRWRQRKRGSFDANREIRIGKYGYDRFAASLAARTHLGELGFRLLRAAMVFLKPFREIVLLARNGGGAVSAPRRRPC